MLRILSLCIALSLTATGAFAESLRRAEAQIRAGAPNEAIALLRDYQPATPEAQVRMLWVLGVANMRLNQPAAALPHLERLVALAPRAPQFRLELAAALGRLGQTERALHHIEIARSAGLPEAIDRRAAEFAQRLENPKVLSGHVSVAIVPESNPVRRTSATVVNLGGLPFQINPNSRAQSATGLELSAGVLASPQLAPGLRGQLGFSVQGTFYNGKAPDDYSGRVYAGLIHGFLETGQSRGQVYVSRRFIDKRPQADTLGVMLGHARRLTPSTRVDGSVTHERVRYTSGLRMTRNAARASVTHVLNPQLDLTFGARLEKRMSQRSDIAGNLQGVSLGGRYRFEGGMQVGVNLDYERNRFEGVHPLFGIPRHDTRAGARLDLSNSQWNWNGFAPVLRLSYERQRSTIIINEFSNFGASLGVTRQF